jgi:hypothetical protein
MPVRVLATTVGTSRCRGFRACPAVISFERRVENLKAPRRSSDESVSRHPFASTASNVRPLNAIHAVLT